MRDHLVAVDVGTASARAGLFDRSGAQLARAVFPIALYRPDLHLAEYDSEEIWAAACRAVRAVMDQSGLTPDRVAAIAFDATCSLVVRGRNDAQVSISKGGNARFDTIAWMDHRAIEQAESLTVGKHPMLPRFGGSFSPEMAIPKLKWLKDELPESWAKATSIFDLSDYLTYRACGSTARSCSTLAAKWGFLPEEDLGWDTEFLEKSGLDDLLGRAGLPERASVLGTKLGSLVPRSADDLGLDTGCAVAPGMIDAYAGAAGLLASLAAEPDRLRREAALVAGTSSCVIRISGKAEPVIGFWGPFLGVGIPGHWLMEGGQSAAGSALDHMVRMHPAGGMPDASLHARIIKRISELRAQAGNAFGQSIDVLPDFHGNRSPLADARATATISGLTLDTSFDGLCRLYWRTAVGIACGIRHIIDALEASGVVIERLHMAGGHACNGLLVQLYANVTGRVIQVPEQADAVLLGSAINAATAAGLAPDMIAAGAAMEQIRKEFRPEPGAQAAHERDYQRHLAMIRHRQELRALR